MVTRDDFVITQNPSGFTLRWKCNYRAIKTFILHPNSIVEKYYMPTGGDGEDMIDYKLATLSGLLIQTRHYRNSLIKSINLASEPELVDPKPEDIGFEVPEDCHCDDAGFYGYMLERCKALGREYKIVATAIQKER